MSKKMKFSCPCGRLHKLSIVDDKVVDEIDESKVIADVTKKEKSKEQVVDDSSGNPIKDFILGRGKFANPVEVEDSDDNDKDDDD